MSNRAAVNFLSSISLGGNQGQKKDSTQEKQDKQEKQEKGEKGEKGEKEKHHHREHFKAKLSSTLEKKHLIHRQHDKPAPPAAPTNPLIPSTSFPATSSSASNNKPSVHPNSLKRSTSTITISTDYNSHAVVRSTSGTAIQSREGSREPSPREGSGKVVDGNSKSRNNSVDQGQAKIRESGDYGIVRKGSDAGATPAKSRTNSTDQGINKFSESSSSLSSSTRTRGESIDNGGKEPKETRRPSEPNTKLRNDSSMFIGSKEYRKLSKSTNDARPPNAIVNSAKSVSTSNVLPSRRADANPKAIKESKEKQTMRGSQDKTSLRVIIPNDEKEEIEQDPERFKRHRRKKSKQKSKKSDRKKATTIKHNPAAVDFLKGISLGENTPTLRKRKSLGKSKLSEVYPRSQDPRRLNDTILFVGSASTKKIKIADYAAQAVPGKLYLSTRSSSTFGVFSVIKYDAKASKKEKEKNSLKDSSIATIGKLKSVTNAPILANTPETTLFQCCFGFPFAFKLLIEESVTIKSETQEVEEREYDPYFLDDPTLTTGKHRTVMNLPCFKESIIPYVRPGVIKDELNELFRQKHPWVPSGVTLHKIRKLKRALVMISVAGGLEVSTVAIAYTLFEKLIMLGLVTKPQIRLYGAVCLILAAKSNDPHGDELKPTIEAIEKHLDVEMKEVWEYEFPVFANAFACSLLLPPDHVIPHIRKIIQDYEDLVGTPY